MPVAFKIPRIIADINGLQAALDLKAALTVTSALDTRLDTAESSLVSLDGRVDALESAGGGGAAFDPKDFGATAGNFSSVSASGVRTANTQAVQDAIDAAQAEGGHVVFTEFYWCDEGLTNNGTYLGMRSIAAGYPYGIGTPDVSGDLLLITNANFSLDQVRFFGPCDFLPSYAGTTHTTNLVRVDHTGGSSANILTSQITGCNFLGGGTGLKLRDATWVHVSRNKLSSARLECLHISTPASSDIGDIFVRENYLHALIVGSLGYSASGSAAMRVTSCSGLYVSDNKVFCQTDQAIDVNLSESAYEDGGATVAIEHNFVDNKFDSGGTVAGSTCIKYRFGGAAVAGNQLRNLIVSENRMSNCVNLLDVDADSGDLEDLTVQDNTGSGGGGIKLRGTITRYTQKGNTFAADGQSWAPTKPVDSTATITTTTSIANTFTGYGSAPDITDTSGGSTDTTPALTTLTHSSGTVTVAGNSSTDIEAIEEVVADENLLVAFPSDLAHGQRGTLFIKHSGDTWTVGLAAAPSGYSLVTTGSIAAGVDDRCDVIEYKCVWTSSPEKKVIFVRSTEGDVVTALTTEGGGGGSTIMEDDFSGSLALIHGRTPTPTAGPATWQDASNNYQVSGTGYAEPGLGSACDAHYAAGVADVVITAVCYGPDSGGSGFNQIYFNWQDANNYWALQWRWDDGYTRWVKVIAGSLTEVDSTTLTIPNATEFTWVITANGDDLSLTLDGSDVTALDQTIASRELKTQTTVGISSDNSGTGIAQRCYNFKVANVA